jgi:hypothetical protein
MTDRTYEVHVSSLVPLNELVAVLSGIGTAKHQMRTVLSEQFTDQAALYGFLARLRAHGLEVVEVRRVPAVEENDRDRGPGR